MPIEAPALLPDPHTIYQRWLDVTSAALMEGDVEGFVSKTSIPFIMRTSGAEMVLESYDDMRGDAKTVVQALAGQQVTDYIRLVKKARYLDEETIEGWHTTYVLRNATAVTPSYGNRMILRWIKGDWKVVEADHELSGGRYPVTLLRSEPGSFDDVWRSAKADISATNARAEPIYQVFLESMAAAANARDFDTWSNHFTFPHDVHYDASDHLVDTPEDLRLIFKLLTDEMRQSEDGHLRLSTLYAEFLSDDRIFGYHETIIAEGDATVIGPVKSRMALTNVEGQWVCSSITTSLSQKDLSETELKVSGKLPTMREIQKRMRK